MSELPKGWTSARFGEVTDIIAGIGFPTDRQGLTSGDLPFCKVSDISRCVLTNSGKLEVSANYVSNEVAKELRGKPIPIGSTVFAKIGEALKLNRRAITIRELLIDNNVMALSPNRDVINDRYLYHFMKTVQLERISQATTVPAVRKSDVQELEIPLAPLNEQKRIVAKLDELLPKVEACKERLQKIPAILKRFRQSVLAAAVSGKLTEEWRTKNSCQQTGSELLASLNTTQPEHHLSIFTNSQRLELPDTWAYSKYGALGKLVSGGTPSRERSDFWNGNYPWVSPKDMKRMRISSSQELITELALKEGKVKRIPAGAILMVVRGMILNHTLPVAIIDRDVAINQDIKALIPACDELSEYLVIAMTALAPQLLFEIKEATHGTRRLETEVLVNFAVPIPPLEEQREIVRLVKKAFAKLDDIRARANHGTTFVLKVGDAILKCAFNGTLVSQDPTDEPASALLERIKSAAHQNNGKQKAKSGNRGRKSKEQQENKEDRTTVAETTV